MAYYNVMERIRKTAGMPSMKGGVPPKEHRKCSDWASFTDAVDTVTGELIADLVACKESYAKLAQISSAQAGKLADLTEKAAVIDLKRVRSEVENTTHRLGLPPSQRDQLTESFEN